MDIQNVKPDAPENRKEASAAPKVSAQKAPESAPVPVKAEPVKPPENTAKAAPANNAWRYIVPDISANPALLSDMSRVNNDIKMIDLKRYGYEQDIEKIKAGLAGNTKDMNAQLHEINALRGKIADADLDRASEVAELKRNIDSGEYKADGAKIAAAMDKFRQ